MVKERSLFGDLGVIWNFSIDLLCGLGQVMPHSLSEYLVTDMRAISGDRHDKFVMQIQLLPKLQQ